MKIRKNAKWLAWPLALVLSSIQLSSAIGAKSKGKVLPDHVNAELVIQFRGPHSTFKPDFKTEAAVFNLLQEQLGEGSIMNVRSLLTDKRTRVVRLAHDTQIGAALRTLRAEPAVQFAEPNYLYHALDDGIPNDPDFAKDWGLKNTGQADISGALGNPGADINVVPLWQEGYRGSQKVLVAVIDTGIDWTHPDIAANLYTNPGEAGPLGSNGKDDDGNGFVDDIHGWNFVAKNNQSQDDNNHGTHVSGTIGGVGNNGIGVAGVNWEVSLLPVKFLDSSGDGSLDNAVEAVNYATLMKSQIMSNSWGGGSASDILKAAIQAAKDAGILFVAAAGNNSGNNDQTPTYPASYPIDNVISVAATDNQDKLAGFSNFGKQSVHVAAPGVNIYSSIKGGKYDTYSGTSMATPHISGIAALLLAANPSWTAAELKNRMIQTSDPTYGLNNKVIAHGRVNAYNAFHDIVPPPLPVPDDSQWQTTVLNPGIESVHPYANSSDLSFTVLIPLDCHLTILTELTPY